MLGRDYIGFRDIAPKNGGVVYSIGIMSFRQYEGYQGTSRGGHRGPFGFLV